MSVFDAAVAAMRGTNYCFDQAIAFIEDVEEQVREADIPAELHAGKDASLAAELFGGETEVTAHFHDPRAEMLAELARARELVREAELAAMRVLAEVP